MAVFDLAQVALTLGGRRVEGFGESDALAWKMATDDWDVVDCCDGGAVHSRRRCRRGEVTITLRFNSTGNKILSDLANGATSFSLSATLPNGDTLTSGEVRGLKRPEPKLGGKPGDYVWTLSCVPLELEYAAGGA